MIVHTKVLSPMLKSDDLLRESPIVVRVTEFKEESVKKFTEDMNKAVSLGMPFVPVLIDSFGGECYSFLSMAYTIKACPVPVITITTSKALSAGAMLFGMGQSRFMSPNSELMFHRASSMSWGPVPCLKSYAEQLGELDKRMHAMVANNLGKPDNFFDELYLERQGADLYVNSKRAVELGIATTVGVPSISVEINARMTIR
jgi:ATP-dependent protease ClpP protease subunit